MQGGCAVDKLFGLLSPTLLFLLASVSANLCVNVSRHFGSRGGPLARGFLILVEEGDLFLILAPVTSVLDASVAFLEVNLAGFMTLSFLFLSGGSDLYNLIYLNHI